MSFAFAGRSAASIPGVEAHLTVWPSAGGQTVDSMDVPGLDGRFFGNTRRTHTTFTFEVTVKGSNLREAQESRDEFLGLIDPAQGPQSLILDGDTEWHYPRTLLAQEVNWEQLGFGSYDREMIYRAEVQMETFGDGSARQIDPEELSFSGSTSYTHDLGTTTAYPRMVITPISTDSEYTISIGDFSVQVSRFRSWTGNVRLDLDWEEMMFFLTDEDGNRLQSAVPHMSHFDRPVLRQGQTYSISVSPERPVRFLPNARRS